MNSDLRRVADISVLKRGIKYRIQGYLETDYGYVVSVIEADEEGKVPAGAAQIVCMMPEDFVIPELERQLIIEKGLVHLELDAEHGHPHIWLNQTSLSLIKGIVRARQEKQIAAVAA